MMGRKSRKTESLEAACGLLRRKIGPRRRRVVVRLSHGVKGVDLTTQVSTARDVGLSCV